MFLELYEEITKPNPDDIFKSLPPEDLFQRRLFNCTKNSDGTYSCDGDVDLSNLGLTKLPVRFKEVTGCFYCYNNNLTNLEGCPQTVGGGFYCYNNKLTTLKGCPQTVGGCFNCRSNPVPERELKKTVKRSYLG